MRDGLSWRRPRRPSRSPPPPPPLPWPASDGDAAAATVPRWGVAPWPPPPKAHLPAAAVTLRGGVAKECDGRRQQNRDGNGARTGVARRTATTTMTAAAVTVACHGGAALAGEESVLFVRNEARAPPVCGARPFLSMRAPTVCGGPLPRGDGCVRSGRRRGETVRHGTPPWRTGWAKSLRAPSGRGSSGPPRQAAAPGCLRCVAVVRRVGGRGPIARGGGRSAAIRITRVGPGRVRPPARFVGGPLRRGSRPMHTRVLNFK